MLSRPEVQRYSAEAGLRDLMIAEKEVVLTFLLQLLSERGVLNRFAFKGGTCLRKMVLGSQGRVSTDLDFTSLREHDHEAVVLDMMEAFALPFQGIQFGIPDHSYYETQDGLSWGVNPTYTHAWNPGGDSEIKVQVSRRETSTLATERLPQCEQSYFRALPFTPAGINCLALPVPCRSSSRRRSAPVSNGTRRATSTTLACSRQGPWIRPCCGAWWS